MKQWLESVYSDGSECFVSNPQPSLGETVKIAVRMYADAPVKHVVLRYMPNGAEQVIDAVRTHVERGLAYYEAQVKMTENRLNYHFCLVCEDVVYYYNQKEITTYLPEIGNDFVLLADYRQPSWVKNAVFYQIFPDRFCNGDASNDVQNGEYIYRGNAARRMNWEDRPLPYFEGYSLDFFGGDSPEYPRGKSGCLYSGRGLGRLYPVSAGSGVGFSDELFWMRTCAAPVPWSAGFFPSEK